MSRKLTFTLIAALATQIVFAQSQHPQSKSFNKGALASATHPTEVKGEGQQTSSGLRYWDILTGTGEPATKGHSVRVLYRAWVENGREFAGSQSDQRPTVFTLGAGHVIAGWEEGVEGMKIGGRRQLKIPPDLAHGAEKMSPFVPANATLIFDVELIGLE